MEFLDKAGITYLLTKLKDHFVQIKNAVLSVNGAGPDENGDVEISRVDTAGNLETSFLQNSTGTFIERPSGGNAAVVNGEARLAVVYGNILHEGFVPEELKLSVQPASEDNIISAEINRDVFVEYVQASSVITLTYTTGWSEDPAEYGVTVTGTPTSGDKIVITYVKEIRGSITAATPETFVSTGWNLYDDLNGYAKVVKYSDEYGYRVSGTYTALAYSATLSGNRSSISPVSGLFSVPGDGYVWVTGGNSTDTAIYPTWSDWTGGYHGDFEGYTASSVDLSSVITANFPYGLCAVGSVRDEINISAGRAVRKIDRVAYTAENLALAKASGRGYEYDEDYIYTVIASPTPVLISLLGTYTVHDHGIEYFTDTIVPAVAQTVYGMNLKNKLERDTVTISQQTLQPDDQRQIRANIGAAGATELAAKMDDSQKLFLVKEYSCKYSMNANSFTKVSASTLGVSAPEGYTPVAVVKYSTSISNGVPYYLDAQATGTETMISLKNLSGEAQSNKNLKVSVLYARTGNVV